MKLSVNGYVKTVVDGDVSSTLIVEIPRYMSKHFYKLPDDKKYNFYITEVQKRRTLAQNDTAWGIMREIARNMDLIPDVEDVYRQILAHANIESTFNATVPEAKKELEKVYRVVIDHGATHFKAKDGTKLHQYECLIGMSKFNRQQMSRFIESLLYFAEMYDVDVTRYERW